MCFSATASFVGAGVITAVGATTLCLVRDVRQLPFAALPLLFGVHQALEGWTWLALGDRSEALLSGAGVHMWVMFAWAVLPAYIPWAVWLMESEPHRRRLQTVPLGVGAVLAVYMLYLAIQPGISVAVVDGNLDYRLGVPFSAAWLAVPYVFATCVAPMSSSHRYVVAMGAGNLVAMSVAAVMNAAGYASIWCTFAAFLSLIVFAHFAVEQRNRTLAA
ncbi:hypothetical protein ACN95_08830 [Gordonia sihwensis]|uniref:DUF6629 family protein n=1 Tax=Gordonia sihwensis TaxID=173559 RepID=UPI001C92BC9D|nr:DUF6629 family protein [Gordonia sihwensis]MBY4570120.1 hypothetical protein [Gordonia sihwensis]